MDGVMQGGIKDMNRAMSFTRLQKLPEGKTGKDVQQHRGRESESMERVMKRRVRGKVKA